MELARAPEDAVKQDERLMRVLDERSTLGFAKPTPGFEPGTPSLRGTSRRYLRDSTVLKVALLAAFRVFTTTLSLADAAQMRPRIRAKPTKRR